MPYGREAGGEVIEGHHADACADAEQLDEMIYEVDPRTRNPPGTLSVRSEGALPPKGKKPGPS